MNINIYEIQIRQYLATEFISKFLKNDNSVEFKKLINDPKFNLNKQQHSSKNINMWEKYGLLKDNRQLKNKNDEITGWKKHSFSQYVWIKIISKLKKYGLRNPYIKKVRHLLTKDNEQSDICEYGMLDFFIKLIVIDNETIFLLADEIGRSILIKKEDILSIESQPDFEYEHMLKISLNKIVLELVEEVNIKFSTE